MSTDFSYIKLRAITAPTQKWPQVGAKLQQRIKR